MPPPHWKWWPDPGDYDEDERGLVERELRRIARMKDVEQQRDAFGRYVGEHRAEQPKRKWRRFWRRGSDLS